MTEDLPSIVVVSLYELADLAASAMQAFEGRARVRILRGHFDGAVEDVQRMAAAGQCDVVLSAGSNADYLRGRVSPPVVSVRVGGFDVMAALSAASAGADATALLLFGEVPAEVGDFLKHYRLPVELRAYRSEAEAERIAGELAAAGLRTLVGPGVAVRAARNLGLRGVFLYSRAAVAAGLEEALSLARAQAAERSDRKRLASVLHHLDDGVVAVDEQGAITAANPAADRLTGISFGAAAGQPLERLLPELSMAVTTRPPQVRQVGDRRLLVRAAPLVEAGRPAGAVFTLSAPNDVEQAFRRLRAQDRAPVTNARYTLDHLVQASPLMKQVVRRCRVLAQHSEAPILVTGPSGVGKELLAQGIHNASRRRARRFIAANCGAFTPSLLESELFGYQAGAFTGARREGRPGLFEAADGGTVFLDEIGELPLELQTRLLRVLQEKEVTRVGSHEPVPVDVRVISATHRDLLAMVREQAFRADLFHRLAVVPVEVAPLAQRGEDLDVLARQMLEASLAEVGMAGHLPRILRHLPAVLRSHRWPGNARELQNFAHRVALSALETGAAPGRAQLLAQIDPWPAEAAGDSLPERQKHGEMAHIRRVLKACEGSHEAAAARLGISRTTLWRRLRQPAD